jgi:hypothetical protein
MGSNIVIDKYLDAQFMIAMLVSFTLEGVRRIEGN